MHSVVYIVLVNWQTPEQTIACVRSLRGLRYENYRIVLVDNGSADDSAARFRAEIPDVELIQSPTNVGFGAGCNLGIKLAHDRGAEYAWILNNDTTVHPDSLSAMVRTAESDPRIGAVGSVIYDAANPQEIQTWGGGRIRWWGTAQHFKHAIASRRIEYLTGASLLLRARALSDVGLLDERYFMYWEDTDLCYRLRKAGWELAVASNSRIWHRLSGTVGRNSTLSAQYRATSYIRFFRSHYSSRWGKVLLGIGIGGRLLARIARGEFRRTAILYQAAMAELREKSVA